ncbi:MAG TPA: small, acid-soluble spore protein, alpha/beta type [Clostridia bacterium]|nr:small, acid-soluble spore protein, alpha/beta type [Clostridia bacterium]
MKAKIKKKKELILTPEDAMKYEIANELGLGEKLSQVGWGGLTAEETGRIGGLITRKKRHLSPKSTATQG